MLLVLFIYLLAMAYIGAKAEIQIEGKHGGAHKLPTWKVKNPITDLLWGNAPITGYHFWLTFFVIGIVHLPVVMGVRWSLAFELQLLGLLAFFWILEDFFWFLLNPHFGFKRFNPHNAPWHPEWLWILPKAYYKFFLIGLFLFWLSYQV